MKSNLKKARCCISLLSIFVLLFTVMAAVSPRACSQEIDRAKIQSLIRERFLKKGAATPEFQSLIPPGLVWLADSKAIKTPGDYARKISSGGLERTYYIHTPKSYKPGQASPVVLVFHGGGGNPNQVRFDSQMDELANRKNFISVYPAGTGPVPDRLLTWNGNFCCGYAQKNKIDDLSFVRHLLDDLAQIAKVDKRRVYATGLSNGAIMTYRLASQLSDRIAAIAPIAYQVNVNEFGAPPRAVSVMHFHGVYDRHAAYNGGPGPDALIQKIENKAVNETIVTWVKHDRCPGKPAKEERIGKAHGVFYGPGSQAAEVVLWTLEDGGHTWPGGRATAGELKLNLGHINTDISASEKMWDFFLRHPMPAK